MPPLQCVQQCSALGIGRPHSMRLQWQRHACSLPLPPIQNGCHLAPMPAGSKCTRQVLLPSGAAAAAPTAACTPQPSTHTAAAWQNGATAAPFQPSKPLHANSWRAASPTWCRLCLCCTQVPYMHMHTSNHKEHTQHPMPERAYHTHPTTTPSHASVLIWSRPHAPTRVFTPSAQQQRRRGILPLLLGTCTRMIDRQSTFDHVGAGNKTDPAPRIAKLRENPMHPHSTKEYAHSWADYCY